MATENDGVTRRDFIHDVALTGLGLALGGAAAGAAGKERPAGAPLSSDRDSYYPPTLTGLRGSHPGAFEAAHALAREGARVGPADGPAEETCDLVIVGAGISGLAAAYFYRQQHGPDARILLLDNHDDFGGHARRNEFHQGDEMRLGWGGTVNMEYWNYSEVGLRLLEELGIDLERLLTTQDYNWSDSGTGLSDAIWFDERTYGRDVLLPGLSLVGADLDALAVQADKIPISERGRTSLRAFCLAEANVLSHLSAPERQQYLRGTAYAEFLREHGGLTADAIQLFSARPVGIWGVRSENISVAEALETGLPGVHLIGGSITARGPEHGRSAMFPDGNASVARLLVRSLLPQAFPGMAHDSDPFDIVSARLDYARLDEAGSPTRLRLRSTVLHVENRDDGVALRYAHDGRLRSVSARRCVLACYNRIIPHICPGLPEAQKAGLAQCVKRPLGTVNVLLRNGHAIQRSGVSSAYLPGSFLQGASVVTGLKAGAYSSDWDPESSRLVHFFFGVMPEEARHLSPVEQSRLGRQQLLAMSFDDFEREVHRVLRGIWGPSGLDLTEDILAITVNRWPHGYARDLIDLEDPAWLATPGPYEIGRQPFGNIVIANSDAGADAYTHTAIDQAWRAVNEFKPLLA
jgi:spermidine dehydrogenase